MTFARRVLDPMIMSKTLRSVIRTGRPILENLIFSLTYGDSLLYMALGLVMRSVVENTYSVIDNKNDLWRSAPFESLSYKDPKMAGVSSHFPARGLKRTRH
jgi:hypothetical protein